MCDLECAIFPRLSNLNLCRLGNLYQKLIQRKLDIQQWSMLLKEKWLICVILRCYLGSGLSSSGKPLKCMKFAKGQLMIIFGWKAKLLACLFLFFFFNSTLPHLNSNIFMSWPLAKFMYFKSFTELVHHCPDNITQIVPTHSHLQLTNQGREREVYAFTSPHFTYFSSHLAKVLF